MAIPVRLVQEMVTASMTLSFTNSHAANRKFVKLEPLKLINLQIHTEKGQNQIPESKTDALTIHLKR